jgi:hypothetical protein
MLNTLPVIVSPTTDRAGFDTHYVVKNTFDTVNGDGTYVGKYSIPSVDLKRCDEDLDFACLLAIGTTPFNIQAKQLDGLDKTATLRSVRFTGAVTYSINVGVTTRSAIELISNSSPEPVLKNEISVLINGLNSFSTLEGNVGVSVFINSLSSALVSELNTSTVGVKFESTDLVKTVIEETTGVSVKIDNKLISNTVEN